MENQNPLDKLYEVVSREGLYTKSKNDFIKKYSNPQEIDKLYNVVSREQLFTKNKDDFYSKYYPDLKKKNQKFLLTFRLLPNHLYNLQILVKVKKWLKWDSLCHLLKGKKKK